MTKILRDNIQQIIALSETHNFREIGDMYGVSRERIRQILQKEGIIGHQREFTYQCWLCPNKFKRVNIPIKEGEVALCSMCISYVWRRNKNPESKHSLREYERTPFCILCGKESKARNLCINHYIAFLYKNSPAFRKMKIEATKKGRAKNKEHYRQYQKEWRHKNRERFNEMKRKSYRRNREKIIAYQKEYKRKKNENLS